MSDATPFVAVEDFIHDMKGAGTLDNAKAVLQRHVERAGFEKFTYWLLSSDGLKTPFYLTTYPAEWVDRYTSQSFIKLDVVNDHSRLALRPFTWNFLKKRYALTRAQQTVFSEASDIRLKTGASIPVHGPGNERSCFSVSNDCSDRELEMFFRAHQREMHLMAIFAHEKIIQLMRAKEPQTLFKLTAREAEILTWSAKGKLRWEIGEILNISEETVKKHLSNASRQLQAKNTPHAVAVALLNGLIRP